MKFTDHMLKYLDSLINDGPYHGYSFKKTLTKDSNSGMPGHMSPTILTNFLVPVFIMTLCGKNMVTKRARCENKP